MASGASGRENSSVQESAIIDVPRHWQSEGAKDDLGHLYREFVAPDGGVGDAGKGQHREEMSDGMERAAAALVCLSTDQAFGRHVIKVVG